MIPTVYIPAFILGAFSSVHCIGMCSPLMLSARAGMVRNGNTWDWFTYNLGRVITYAALGLLFGLFGESIKIAGFQNYLSLISGLVVVLLAVSGFNLVPAQFNPFNRLNKWVVKHIGFSLTKRSAYGLMLFGMLNGLLPCGMVYFAGASAIVLGNSLSAVVFMIVFGLATLPAMLAVGVLSERMSVLRKFNLNRYLPVFSILIGLLLILRGLNLGIPYVSPKIEGDRVNGSYSNIVCHP